MISNIQIRQNIVKRVKRISSDKLEKLVNFINKLEKNTEKKSKILSYAGSWKNIDKKVFDELTKNLISNRSKNKRRFDNE